MEFTLGVITGLIVAQIIVATLIMFRAKVERGVERIQGRIEQAGPNPKGAIYLPDDEATVARQKIIKRNKEAGRDTPISELQ